MAEVATDSSEWSDVKQDGSEIDEAVKQTGRPIAKTKNFFKKLIGLFW
jgi:hypothetical protein